MNQTEPPEVDGQQNEEVAVDLPKEETSTEQTSNSESAVDSSEGLEQLKQQVEAADGAVAKIEVVITYMAACLETKGNPRFKEFWEARKLCLPLFKEKLPATVRTELWNRYRELSDEAKRLKNIFDEQSAFAVEQIGIAIDALEADLEKLSDTPAPDANYRFQSMPKALEDKMEQYAQWQASMVMLNGYASQINALRKELIQTEMRVRHKNAFFKRLSAAGDRVFPRRKELIKLLSTAFVKDVEAFISRSGAGSDLRQQLFHYREEIKAFQGMSKELSLNTRAFSATREQLSGLWDKLRELGKERKKEQQERHQVSRENADKLLERIDEVQRALEAGEMSLAEAGKGYSEISGDMRKAELTRPDVIALRERLTAARKIVEQKESAVQQEQNKRRAEREEARQKKVTDIQNQLEEALQQAIDKETLDTLVSSVEEAKKSLPLESMEEMEIDRLVSSLQDKVAEQEESRTLEVAQDLQALQVVLDQRRDRLNKCKERLDLLKKEAGTSNLDFERAMYHRELLEAEQERLQQLRTGVDEVEARMKSLAE